MSTSTLSKQLTIDLDKVAWPAGFVGIDFETYGDVNLPKYGLDNYVNDPSFKPLIVSVSDANGQRTYDFVRHPVSDLIAFKQYVNDTISWNHWFVAHNVGFERAVMQWLGFDDEVLYRITDSAVVARWMGAASHLEAAAPQLTALSKLEIGKELIMLFSVPNEKNGGKPFTWKEINGDTELRYKWAQFVEYCERDAAACNLIVITYWRAKSFEREHRNEWYTYLMNRTGWNVDLALVREMQLRYDHNSNQLTSDFMTAYNIENEKFLNSTPQMVAWCAERGIKTTSFDAEHIVKLQARLKKAVSSLVTTDPRWEAYHEVLDLLKIKQELGGSSLKKLQTILDLTGKDGRLRNQYMHCGAGQSYRSTGKGVQLQNLKRLSSEPIDFDDEDTEPLEDIDNTTMAENLRQVFYSDVSDGRQIVGDFSSVESRILAWVAGADWKIKAFMDGLELYKVQAAAIYGKHYDDVTKPERQVGKVGELGCGYGVGPESLVRFAAKMGIEMTVDDALDLVRNWRGTNPEVVALWALLHDALHEAIVHGTTVSRDLAHGLTVVFEPFEAPASLRRQHPGVQSMRMLLYGDGMNEFILERVFQGVYMRGNDMCFYKPSDRKTGDLWVNHYRDPKTGKIVFYKLYGGKLTGILIQSIARELFFDCVALLFKVFEDTPNVNVIGQFHDELVVSWWPDPRGKTLIQAKTLMSTVMSMKRYCFNGFPLVADIKDDYRYTK